MKARVSQLALLLGIALASSACSCSTMEARSSQRRVAANSASSPNTASTAQVTLPDESERSPAPGFQGATAWMNVSRPLTNEDLRGHVVLVDFWTSCCINCLHTLPVLLALEERMPATDFMVVGVHSPKFTAERESDRLDGIVRQYGIRHPIAVDGRMAVWDRWGARSWPTLALLDAQSRVVWTGSGEPDLEELSTVVRATLAEGEARHELTHRAVDALAPFAEDDSALSYPSGIAIVDAHTFAVADTAHNRVLVVEKTGRVLATIDGFLHPHGLVAHGAYLYVADTDHHQLKRIDLRSNAVEVVAGTGSIGEGPLRDQWRPARETGLRSPWAVTFVANRLFVALAGSHQIAEIDEPDHRIRGYAGNGREALVDGNRVDASFAQPSALTSNGNILYVLDSESSSVRAIDLASSSVTTLVGKGLFEFGDIDGDRETARLQHPIGMVYAANALFVADTYNSAIRRVDPARSLTSTRLRSTNHEPLFEPAAIAFDGSNLFIADTNHQRIVMLDPRNGEARPLALTGVPGASRSIATAEAEAPVVERELPVITLAPVALPHGSESRVRLVWDLPRGTMVNEDAPFEMRVRALSQVSASENAISRYGRDVQSGQDLRLRLADGAREGSIDFTLDMVVCDAVTHAVCVPVERVLHLVLRANDHARPSADVHVALPAAEAP